MALRLKTDFVVAMLFVFALVSAFYAFSPLRAYGQTRTDGGEPNENLTQFQQNEKDEVTISAKLQFVKDDKEVSVDFREVSILYVRIFDESGKEVYTKRFSSPQELKTILEKNLNLPNIKLNCGTYALAAILFSEKPEFNGLKSEAKFTVVSSVRPAVETVELAETIEINLKEQPKVLEFEFVKEPAEGVKIEILTELEEASPLPLATSVGTTDNKGELVVKISEAKNAAALKKAIEAEEFLMVSGKVSYIGRKVAFVELSHNGMRATAPVDKNSRNFSVTVAAETLKEIKLAARDASGAPVVGIEIAAGLGSQRPAITQNDGRLVLPTQAYTIQAATTAVELAVENGTKASDTIVKDAKTGAPLKAEIKTDKQTGKKLAVIKTLPNQLIKLQINPKKKNGIIMKLKLGKVIAVADFSQPAQAPLGFFARIINFIRNLFVARPEE